MEVVGERAGAYFAQAILFGDVFEFYGRWQ